MPALVAGDAWEKCYIVMLQTTYHSEKSTIFYHAKRHLSAVESIASMLDISRENR